MSNSAHFAYFETVEINDKQSKRKDSNSQQETYYKLFENKSIIFELFMQKIFFKETLSTKKLWKNINFFKMKAQKFV